MGCEEREIFKFLSCSLGVMEFSLIQKDQSNGKGVGPNMNVDPTREQAMVVARGPGWSLLSVNCENTVLLFIRS